MTWLLPAWTESLSGRGQLKVFRWDIRLWLCRLRAPAVIQGPNTALHMAWQQARHLSILWNTYRPATGDDRNGIEANNLMIRNHPSYALCSIDRAGMQTKAKQEFNWKERGELIKVGFLLGTVLFTEKGKSNHSSAKHVDTFLQLISPTLSFLSGGYRFSTWLTLKLLRVFL